VRSNESAVLEFVHNSTEHSEFFFHEGSFNAAPPGGGTSSGPILAKRRASDMYEHANGSAGTSSYDWAEHYLMPPTKRASVHSMFMTSSTTATNNAAAAAAAVQHLYAGHPNFLDYQNGLQSHSEIMVS
jgi:hypothetical protein